MTHSTTPCPCSLTEAPRHILDPFKRIEWAMKHLQQINKSCQNPDPAEDRFFGAGYHNAGIRCAVRTTTETSASRIHRELELIAGEAAPGSAVEEIVFKFLGLEREPDNECPTCHGSGGGPEPALACTNPECVGGEIRERVGAE